MSSLGSQERQGSQRALGPISLGREAQGEALQDPRGPHPQLPTQPPSCIPPPASHRNKESGVGQCPSASRRCQAPISMALAEGPADDSIPTGDPNLSAGAPGPSQAPASPVARRRALLRELEAQVQAAYGQVKGAGVGGCPQLRGHKGTEGTPAPTGAL